MIYFPPRNIPSKKLKPILDRAQKLYGREKINRFDLQMDLCAAHDIVGIDIDRLMKFDDFSFMHDITGIFINLDREKGEMGNSFLPRCHKKKIEAVQ